MKHTTVAFGLIAFLIPVTVQADPIGIRVLSATYSTTVAFGIWQFPNGEVQYRDNYIVTSVTRARPVSQAPEGDALTSPSSAAASADWLTVFAESWDSAAQLCCQTAYSSAEFAMTFSPIADGLATIDYYGYGGPYSHGAVNLFDVTTGQNVWQFEHLVFGLTTETQLTLLNASHVYDLRLSVWGQSLNDRTEGTLNVSGLYAVPEPSSLIMLVAGLAGVGVFRGARTRKASGPTPLTY